MMNFLIRLLIMGLMCLSIQACQQGDGNEPISSTDPVELSATYQGKGVITTITPSGNYVKIDHEEIPGFMSAMEMFFSLEDTTLLSGLSVADSVVFGIGVTDSKYSIVSLRKIE